MMERSLGPAVEDGGERKNTAGFRSRLFIICVQVGELLHSTAKSADGSPPYFLEQAIYFWRSGFEWEEVLGQLNYEEKKGYQQHTHGGDM